MSKRREFLKKATFAGLFSSVFSKREACGVEPPKVNIYKTKDLEYDLNRACDIRREVEKIVNEKSLARHIMAVDDLNFGEIPRYGFTHINGEVIDRVMHIIHREGAIPLKFEDSSEVLVPTYELQANEINIDELSASDIANKIINKENNEFINLIKSSTYTTCKNIYDAHKILEKFNKTPKISIVKGDEDSFNTIVNGYDMEICRYPKIPFGTCYICADLKDDFIMPVRQNLTIIPYKDRDGLYCEVFEEIGFASLDNKCIVKVDLN